LLQLRENAARLDGHREIDGIDRADAIHAAEGENDVVSVLRRDAAADEPGIAALRHDRQPCLGADPHHCRDLGSRRRTDNEPGRAAPQAPRLGKIGLLLGGIVEPAACADRRFDPLQRRLDFHQPLFDCHSGHVSGVVD
jgi:hypothetical protein